jgi:hypothetical protein
MAKFRILIFLLFLCVLFPQRAEAQIGISHEVGILLGPASFFTDYGERWNVKNNLENAGFGIGFVHYMNFAYQAECNCYPTQNYFSDHFKIRTEMDYLFSDLEHYGPVANKDSEGGRLLRAMHGRTQLLEIGAALEYYPFSLKDYMSFGLRFSPYIAAGFHFVYFKPTAWSDLGDINNPKVIFPTFVGGIDLDGGTTWSLQGSIGTRYRLNLVSDLVVEARWNYYDTDWLDGLNIDAPQNKYNDFVMWFTVGYVYYLNY